MSLEISWYVLIHTQKRSESKSATLPRDVDASVCELLVRLADVEISHGYVYSFELYHLYLYTTRTLRAPDMIPRCSKIQYYRNSTALMREWVPKVQNGMFDCVYIVGLSACRRRHSAHKSWSVHISPRIVNIVEFAPSIFQIRPTNWKERSSSSTGPYAPQYEPCPLIKS